MTSTPPNSPALPETLPALDSKYALSPARIEAYNANGFVLLRNLASVEEVEAYRPVLWDLTMSNSGHRLPLMQRTTYGKAFIQVSNLWEMDAAAARFTLSRRFAQVAAQLMGVAGVRIYHDQALYKEPGGGFTPWHQDQQYWPLDGAKTITLWMTLVDADESMGTMRFAAGSQALGYLGPQPISDDSEIRWGKLVQERGYPIVAAGVMKAGDATFHSGWTLHGAPGNSSEAQTREVMTIIYVEDGAVITPPDSENRENDLARWLPGRKPGETAASPLNPLVWRRPE